MQGHRGASVSAPAPSLRTALHRPEREVQPLVAAKKNTQRRNGTRMGRMNTERRPAEMPVLLLFCFLSVAAMQTGEEGGIPACAPSPVSL